MLRLLSGVMPFAIAIIISPVPVAAAITAATSRRRVANGSSFLGGWFIGLLLLVILFSMLGARLGREIEIFIYWLELVLGLFLWGLAWLEWHNRHKKGATDLVTAVEDLTPRNAAIFGFLLATITNPKNIPLVAAMGATVAGSGVGAGQAMIVGFIFTVFSSLSIALAVGLPMTKPGGKVMDRFRDWLERRSTAILVPLFVVLGALLISHWFQGIRSL